MLTTTKKIFIIAGEESGDILAGGMMQEINKISKDKIEYHGIGEYNMKKAGLKRSLFPMKELSIMGLDVIYQLPHMIKRINQTVEYILNLEPDMVISVDSPDFCFRVLKKVRAKNKDVKLVHYVSPTVWAWREKRAEKISKFLDGILLLFPFEKKYYPNIKSTYIGHRAYTQFKAVKPINKTNSILCLPGSRINEIKKIFPTFINTINNLYNEDKSITITIPVAKNVKDLVKEQAKNIKAKYKLVYDKKDNLNAKIALCTSGTASFELALKEIPTVVGYKASFLTYSIGKLLIKSKWVSLANIILNKEVMPEFIQKECSVDNLTKECSKLLYSQKNREKQIKLLKQIKNKLKCDTLSPDKDAAKTILEMLK